MIWCRRPKTHVGLICERRERWRVREGWRRGGGGLWLLWLVLLLLLFFFVLFLLLLMLFSCHRPFLPDTSLEPAVIPTSQATSFRQLYFPYYVWCSNHSCLFVVNLLNISLVGLSHLSSHLLLLLVATIITGIITHFRFCIYCISKHKILYFSIFSASFCTTFLSMGIATSISTCVFSFLFLIIISSLLTVTSHNNVTSSCSHNGLGVCVCHLSVVSMPRDLHTEWWKCALFLLLLL